MNTLVFFPILEEIVAVFPIYYDISYRFVIIAFTMLRNIPSIPTFSRAFIRKVC
jgi:hypothetical protein